MTDTYQTNHKEAEDQFKLNAVASIYKFKDRIDMWEKDHKQGVKPPMIQTKDGSYIWLNRALRRKKH